MGRLKNRVEWIMDRPGTRRSGHVVTHRSSLYPCTLHRRTALSAAIRHEWGRSFKLDGTAPCSSAAG